MFTTLNIALFLAVFIGLAVCLGLAQVQILPRAIGRMITGDNPRGLWFILFMGLFPLAMDPGHPLENQGKSSHEHLRSGVNGAELLNFSRGISPKKPRKIPAFGFFPDAGWLFWFVATD